MILSIYPVIYKRKLCTDTHGFVGIAFLRISKPHFHKNYSVIYLEDALAATKNKPVVKPKSWRDRWGTWHV